MSMRGLGGPFFIEETCDGCYLCNHMGFVVESDEAIEIARDLIRFARKHEDFLVDKNVQVDRYYKDMMNGKYDHTEEKKPKTKSCVYLFKCRNMYKVGISKDVEKRLKKLNNRPYPVELVAKSAPITCARKVEKNIHEQLRGYRIDGEWFELPEDVAERVSKCIENLSQ